MGRLSNAELPSLTLAPGQVLKKRGHSTVFIGEADGSVTRFDGSRRERRQFLAKVGKL